MTIDEAIKIAPEGVYGLLTTPWFPKQPVGIAADWSHPSNSVLYFEYEDDTWLPNGKRVRDYQDGDFRVEPYDALRAELEYRLKKVGDPTDDDIIERLLDSAKEFGDEPQK